MKIFSKHNLGHHYAFFFYHLQFVYVYIYMDLSGCCAAGDNSNDSITRHYYCYYPRLKDEATYKAAFNVCSVPDRVFTLQGLIPALRKIVHAASFDAVPGVAPFTGGGCSAFSNGWILKLFCLHKPYIQANSISKLYRLVELMEGTIRWACAITFDVRTVLRMGLPIGHAERLSLQRDVRICEASNQVVSTEAHATLSACAGRLQTLMMDGYRSTICFILNEDNVQLLVVNLEFSFYHILCDIVKCVLLSSLASDRGGGGVFCELERNAVYSAFMQGGGRLLWAVAMNTRDGVVNLVRKSISAQKCKGLLQLLVCCYLRARLMYFAACVAQQLSDGLSYYCAQEQENETIDDCQ